MSLFTFLKVAWCWFVRFKCGRPRLRRGRGEERVWDEQLVCAALLMLPSWWPQVSFLWNMALVQRTSGLALVALQVQEHTNNAGTAPDSSPPKTREVFPVQGGAYGLSLDPAASKCVPAACSEHTHGIAPCFGHSETCPCLGSIAVAILK